MVLFYICTLWWTYIKEFVTRHNTCLVIVAIRLRGIEGLKERQFIDAVKGGICSAFSFLDEDLNTRKEVFPAS